MELLEVREDMASLFEETRDVKIAVYLSTWPDTCRGLGGSQARDPRERFQFRKHTRISKVTEGG
jgi:hypothetical protein